MSEVLYIDNIRDAWNPMETVPKSISPTEKWKDGPTTRPLKVSGRGIGWPFRMQWKVSCTSPSVPLLKPTSHMTCSRGCRTPASGVKRKHEPSSESFGASEYVASISP
eukprot:scaffold7123_cov119-Isochrysis_galbana.AAC.13